MHEAMKAFLAALSRQIEFLLKLRDFLLCLPILIEEGKIDSRNFFHTLEQFELNSGEILGEKQHAQQQLAQLLGVAPREITMSILGRLGYGEAEQQLRRCEFLQRELSYLLLRASIYVRRFSELNRVLLKWNDFLRQCGYSSRGESSGLDRSLQVSQEA